MTIGDQVRRIEPSDLLILSSAGDVVGVKSGKSSGDAGYMLSASVADATQALASGERNREYPLELYGVVYQAATYTTAAITASSAALAVTGYTFTSSDVGKTVGVAGAGVVSGNYVTVANDGVLVATILSVAGGLANLSVTATNTVSGARCVFGFPIDTALAAAVTECAADYAVDGIVGKVTIPAGKYLAVTPQTLTSGISVSGAGRDITSVYVVKVVADATNSTVAPWLRTSGSLPRAQNVSVRDLTLIGTFYAAEGAYGSQMKMISISTTDYSVVQRIKSIDNPSTAIGYDESTNCLIADNIIINAGRLATPTASNGSAGGSGIGVAIGGISDLSIIIRNNFISGLWTASGGTGRSGINIEAASNIADPPTYYGGLLVEGNFVEGYFNGIVDSGAVGTIIKGNTVRRCTHGIKAGTNNVSVGRISRDTIIVGNRVADLFTVSPATNSIGIAATTTSATKDSQGRIKISQNVVTGVVGGYGIQLLGSVTYPLRNVSVVDNLVAESDLSGIRVNGYVYALVISLNQLVSNGKALTAGNRGGVRIDTGTIWQDGQISGNIFTDYQGSPTQDTDIVFNGTVTMTSVATDIRGTATLVAGTVAVSNARIAAGSLVRVARLATGGTLGNLSVAITAGTSFTVNSSSGTDTSTVLWEIVKF